MADDTQRYRITVTPIGRDGLQCSGRCTIEFEHAGRSDWMRLLEAAQRQHRLSGDECAALVVGTELLDSLMRNSGAGINDTSVASRLHLDALIETLRRRSDSA